MAGRHRGTLKGSEIRHQSVKWDGMGWHRRRSEIKASRIQGKEGKERKGKEGKRGERKRACFLISLILTLRLMHMLNSNFRFSISDFSRRRVEQQIEC